MPKNIRVSFNKYLIYYDTLVTEDMSEKRAYSYKCEGSD